MSERLLDAWLTTEQHQLRGAGASCTWSTRTGCTRAQPFLKRKFFPKKDDLNDCTVAAVVVTYNRLPLLQPMPGGPCAPRPRRALTVLAGGQRVSTDGTAGLCEAELALPGLVCRNTGGKPGRGRGLCLRRAAPRRRLPGVTAALAHGRRHAARAGRRWQPCWPADAAHWRRPIRLAVQPGT